MGDSDRADFDAFFAAEETDLLRFCWALTLDRHDARDIAQEAMTRAFEKWPMLATGNPAGWVRTVALNLVRNRWRSSKRRDAAVNRLGAQARLCTEDSHPTSAEVIAALESLTGRQREAVVLHHMVELPVAEVAESMGTSVATVKTHLQRGRASLAGLLRETPTDGGDHG